MTLNDHVPQPQPQPQPTDSQDGTTSLGAMFLKDSPTSLAYPAYRSAESLQMSMPPPSCLVAMLVCCFPDA